MTLRKNGKYYHVYLKENGKVRSLATDCTDKTGAIASDIQADLDKLKKLLDYNKYKGSEK